jgi:Ni/Co efflux regulator RcnB
MHMNKSLLAVATSALMLASIGSASAQSYERTYDSDSSYENDARYATGNAATYDYGYDNDNDGRYDDRDGSRYDERYDPRYDPRYATGTDPRNDPRYAESRVRYDRYGNRLDGRNGSRYDNRSARAGRNSHDRDCDGISDRYDRHDQRSVNDRDCDGIDNRFDRNDGRHHDARRSFVGSRYVAPRGYSYTRYAYGSRLPTGYWGNNYYVDYQPYGLAQPPSGYRWNRVGNDVYMVSTRNGLIAEAVYSLFR